MRFDNPVYDHFLDFPDIAEFPDVKDEYKLEHKIDLSLLYKLGEIEKFHYIKWINLKFILLNATTVVLLSFL